MKFDIWTFFFQIINFVVLVLILKRLLYKPVKEILDKRKEIARRTMEDAERMKKEAMDMREEQTREMGRLRDEKIQLMEKMRSEADEVRKKLLLRAEEEARNVIEKERSLFDAEKKRVETQVKQGAVEAAKILASNLLRDITDEELHRSIWRHLFDETGRISSEVSRLRETTDLEFDVRTAYPLGEIELKKFRDAIASRTGRNVAVHETPDPALIAGVRIKAYDMVYDFSLSGQIETMAAGIKEGG